jgi:diguanylate cyclase (GGDEF)-like protein
VTAGPSTAVGEDRASRVTDYEARLRELYLVVFGPLAEETPPDEMLDQLNDALAKIRAGVRALSDGDLRGDIPVSGPIAGSLKSLAASLKHLAWQAKEIADGDLSQRVDFLGEFSVAFNNMAERLDATLTELRIRERELSEANASLEAAQGQLIEQATHDPLTGLLNRRSLSERWLVETARADRTGEPIAVLLVDLDEFKSVNDNCGHEGGDIVLAAFADTLSHLLRASDIACRIGGDEFAVILPGTSPEDGMHVADRVREEFASADLGPLVSKCSHTASIGMAQYPAHGNDLDSVLRAADEALYEVKAAGRNKVVCAK